MAIGKDPREWIMEIGGVVAGGYGTVTGLVGTDYILAIISVTLLIVTLNHYQMRRNFSISVRDH